METEVWRRRQRCGDGDGDGGSVRGVQGVQGVETETEGVFRCGDGVFEVFRVFEVWRRRQRECSGVEGDGESERGVKRERGGSVLCERGFCSV